MKYLLIAVLLAGCASKPKEPRVCTDNELKVRSMTKYHYRFCTNVHPDIRVKKDLQ